MTSRHINTEDHQLTSADYAAQCRAQLDEAGALVLPQFFRADAIDAIVAESAPHEGAAFYAGSTHNVWLTPNDDALPADHVFNRQIVSSKGLIADDQIPPRSPLRDVYNDASFQAFLCGVLGIDAIHPYADDFSSINVHFAAEGMELGWHFDNSSFAVTMLLQAPEEGSDFEYVSAVRDSASGDDGFDAVRQVLDGETPVQTLHFNPGDLVLFRGRDAMHRVTPTMGDTTRLLVVFAYNDQPGVALSESALATFYGRTT